MHVKRRIVASLRAGLGAFLMIAPLGLSAPTPASAQTDLAPAVASSPVVPQQVRYAGKLLNRAGETVEVVFRIYSAAEGGEPLWTETQRVPVAQDGSYTVLLGAADPKGLPQQVFAGGVARWLGLSVEQSAEQERVLLASVPYAMKSADAEALSGHAASDFVTQEQLAALTAQGEQPVAPDQNAKPLTSGTITGSGTNGTVALFNGTNTIGNSNIVQSGTEIGINETTPAATLDVGGTETVRGQLTLPSIATATTANGSPSEPLQLQANAWSTTSNSAGNDTYALQAIPTGNDTASPSSTLYLFHQPAGGSASSILSIANTGLIKFAPGQLFPGTLTGALATSPLVAGVAGNNLTLQLNVPTLATSLNSYFPQLSVANTFHASQTVQGGLTVTGNITADNIGATANLTAGVVSLTGSILAATSHVATATGGFNSPLFEMGASAFNSTSAAAQNETFYWQAVPTGNNTATPSANLQLSFSAGTASPTATGLSIGANGIIHFASGQTFPGGGGGTLTGITTSSPLTGSGTSGSVALGLNTSALETTLNTVYPQLGSYNTFTSGATFEGLLSAEANGIGTSALQGLGTSGANGVLGSSDIGIGVVGNSTAPAEGASGILGFISSTLSPSFTTVEQVGTAGVWGDANGVPAGADWSAGVIGTASSDFGYGGLFYNNSPFKSAMIAQNANSGGGITAVSTGGNGVLATSTTGNGLVGYSTTPGAGISGVLGYTSNGTSGGYSTVAGNHFVAGVWGDTSGNTNPGYASAGVIGTSNANLGYGGYFLNSAPELPAVFAQNNSGVGIQSFATGGDGVQGYSSGGSGGAGTGGSGVYGFAQTPEAGSAGVIGITYTTSNTRTTFLNTGPGFVAGVWGDAGTAPTGTELYKAGVVGTGDDITAAVFENDSPNNHPTISAVALASGPTGLFKTLMAASPDGVCGFGSGGDMNCTGRVKSLVSVGDGARKVETYSVQSPENWMEDFGSGELRNGVAVVKIDPAFAETVSAGATYKVFITPNGDAEALYVINKSATGFEVRESKGGTSSLSFDYRIVAKRRGYEKERLTDVTERFNAEKAQAMPPVHPGIEHGPLPQPHSPVLMEGPVTPAKIPAAAESPLLGAPHSHRTPIPLPGVHPVVRKTAAGHPESTTHP